MLSAKKATSIKKVLQAYSLQDFFYVFIFMFLPDMRTLALWNKELVALLDVECLIP